MKLDMRNVYIFQGSFRYIKKRAFYLSKISEIYFLLGEASKIENFSLAEKYGWKQVDISKEQDLSQEQILEDYMNIIASFSQWNAGSLNWWATHFSSKNRLNSPVLPNLQELHQSLSAIDKLKEHETLVIINISWPAVEALQALATKIGYEFKIYSPLFLKVKDRLIAKGLFWKLFFVEFFFSFLSIWKAKKAFGKPDMIKPNTPIYLIKSFTYLRNFRKNIYVDPFFGRLPNYLKEQFPDSSILTVASGFQDRVKCYNKMKDLSNNMVHPMEIYLTYWDVIKKSSQLFWNINFNPFKIKGKLFWLGYDITPFFKELISFGGLKFSFCQTLQFDIAKRLGKRYHIKTCLMTYEGRPWERFFIEGLRKANFKTNIVGCQHTVIPLSAADMFLHPHERDIIPLPDKIVTTGKIPKRILEKYGSYPKKQIHVGCALRFESLQNTTLLKNRGKNKNKFVLLVAFGGSEEEVPLLNYTLKQASKNKNSIFRIRTHPALSFEKLLHLSSWKNVLPTNVVQSKFHEVFEDLRCCDAVLYWGTTVALESLMVGKPIIHFVRGDLLNYDPLFEFADFKWQVKKRDSLQIAIQEILALPDTLYSEKQKKGLEYVKKYFSPVTKENLDTFLYN